MFLHLWFCGKLSPKSTSETILKIDHSLAKTMTNNAKIVFFRNIV